MFTETFFRFRPGRLMAFLAAGLLFLAAWAALMEVRAGAELKSARLALAGEQPDYDKAVRHYFRALNWYSPAGSSQTAADEFLALALRLEERGSRREAFDALLKLRSALYAARSFYQPRRDILATADSLLAWHLAEQAVGYERPGRALDFLARVEFYYHLYSAPSLPHEGWALAAVAGFWLWAGGVLAFIFKVFGPRAVGLSLGPRLAGGRYALLTAGLGCSLWVVGLLKT